MQQPETIISHIRPSDMQVQSNDEHQRGVAEKAKQFNYIAHSENSGGIKQTMKEHSSGVGKFMREFALSESFADLYEFCGLIHDIGKYSESFQMHIAGAGNKVRHSIYGAIYAKEHNLLEIAIPVYGHHAGLPDRSDMFQDIKAEHAVDKGIGSSQNSVDLLIETVEYCKVYSVIYF